jgi:hypothetical protein
VQVIHFIILKQCKLLILANKLVASDDKNNIRNYVNTLGLVTHEEVNMIKQAGFKKPRTLTTKINKVVTKLAKTIWSIRNVKIHS